MLRMLCYRIDRPSSRSFSMHSIYISDTQGKTRWEGSSSPSLCPADHSASILHSRLHLTATWGCSYRYVSLSGSLAPPVISFYDMLLSSPYSICHLVISASLWVSTLKYIENFMVQVKSSFRYYKSLSSIMYVFVREEFSFDKLYYLCFGIFLNECYGCTLVYIGSLVV